MSSGCAILASDTGPVHEAIQHGVTGRLLPFFDVAAWVQGINRLMNEPAERQRVGEAARARAIERYDLQTVCLPRQLAWVQALAKSL